MGTIISIGKEEKLLLEQFKILHLKNMRMTNEELVKKLIDSHPEIIQFKKDLSKLL